NSPRQRAAIMTAGKRQSWQVRNNQLSWLAQPAEDLRFPLAVTERRSITLANGRGGAGRRSGDRLADTAFGMACAHAPGLAVERVGMSEIIRMGVDHAGARIGFDQDLSRLTRLAEEPPIGFAVLRHAEMATGHAWRDAIGIIPRGGDFALPVGGLVFDCAQGPRHAFCPGRRLGMFRPAGIRPQQHGNADRHDDGDYRSLDHWNSPLLPGAELIIVPGRGSICSPMPSCGAYLGDA